jgi:hypothetical protein
MKMLLLALISSMAITNTAISADPSDQYNLTMLTTEFKPYQHRIKSAQMMLDTAKSQSDLNHASKELMIAWEIELSKKQKGVEAMLSKPSLRTFRSSMKLWKKHVEQMSMIRSELFMKNVTDPLYLRTRGIKDLDLCMSCVAEMSVYVYNMSMSIYYEEKWTELNSLTNNEL